VPQPNWQPAEQHVPHLLDDLMWMGSITHNDVVIEKYKHCDTRRYLNLDATGQAWQIRVTEDGGVGARPISLQDGLRNLDLGAAA
jgi:hypothetical protein